MSSLRNYKKKIAGVVFWTILIISFIFFAGLVHLKANGWQLNYHTWQLVETGMITLNGTPKNAKVKVNGVVKSDSLPIKIGNLSQGYYDIEVSANSFQSWQKTIQVQPGRASLNQNIILFLSESKNTTVPQNINETDFKNAPENGELKFSGSEIYWQEKLVSRFSQDILMVKMYPDDAHIIFQMGNEIRVMDIDGTNNKLLFNLESSTPVQIIFDKSGETVYCLADDKIIGRTIK